MLELCWELLARLWLKLNSKKNYTILVEFACLLGLFLRKRKAHLISKNACYHPSISHHQTMRYSFAGTLMWGGERLLWTKQAHRYKFSYFYPIFPRQKTQNRNIFKWNHLHNSNNSCILNLIFSNQITWLLMARTIINSISFADNFSSFIYLYSIFKIFILLEKKQLKRTNCAKIGQLSFVRQVNKV